VTTTAAAVHFAPRDILSSTGRQKNLQPDEHFCRVLPAVDAQLLVAAQNQGITD